jgi:hypothetical protein
MVWPHVIDGVQLTRRDIFGAGNALKTEWPLCPHFESKNPLCNKRKKNPSSKRSPQKLNKPSDCRRVRIQLASTPDRPGTGK